MFTLARNLVLTFLLVAPLMGQAANLPTPAIGNSIGLNIHFVRGNTKDLDMMAAAGNKFVRMDFIWKDIETQKGVYNWAAYDELINNIVKRGMRPYLILDFSNQLYEEVHILTTSDGTPYAAYVDSPNSPDSVAAFAAWAKAAAVRYKSKNVIWEIWNEPNITFWKPTPNVGDYTTLSKATCNAIHTAVPNSTVIGGATSKFDWDFLYAYLGSGVLECIDGVSVHPYRDEAPETASAEIAYLKWVIDQYAPITRTGKIPVISGEWGYSTATTSFSFDIEAAQAAYAVRMQLNNLLNNVPISIWYDWKNDGTDPANREYNFGIVTASLSLKPAYTALKTLSAQMGSYKLVNRIATGNDQEYVLLFANSLGKKKVVAWTTSPSSYATTILAQMTTSTTGIAVPVVSMTGSSSTATIKDTGMPITLSFTPQYIDLSKL